MIRRVSASIPEELKKKVISQGLLKIYKERFLLYINKKQIKNATGSALAAQEI